MDREKLKQSFLRGVSASVLTGMAIYFGVRLWITVSISLGPVDKLYAVADAAALLATIIAFLNTTLIFYTSVES